MDRYEIGPDGTIRNVGGGSSNRSGNNNYNGYNSNNIYNNGSNRSSGYNYRSYRHGVGAKVFAIIAPLVSFIVGQIFQYIKYSTEGRVRLMDSVFVVTPMWALVLSTVLGAISTIHIMVRAWKLADDYEEGWSVFYVILFSALFAIIPCVTGYFGIIVTSAISWCLEECYEESIPWIFFITLIVFVVLGFWIGGLNSGIAGVELAKIEEFSQIDEYLSNEQIALDITELKEDDCGTITTGEACTSLILVGRRGKNYNGLKIVTNAQSITFKNINIKNGYLECSLEQCTFVLMDKNSIEGIHGSNGSSGVSGNSGISPLKANSLILSGNGSLMLTAGNGGDGGDGKNGNGAFLFGNGSDGQHGGNGGDSSFVVNCNNLSEYEFSGKLTLKKGTAGKGGSGGKGGVGGLFGSAGSNGWDGYNGAQRDFCSGEILVSEEKLSYIE